jgi:hypothetical protein
MDVVKTAKSFLLSREGQKGQNLVIFALMFVFVVLPIAAWAIDQGSLYQARRERQKLVDSACLDGVITSMNGGNTYTGITDSLTLNGLDSSYYTPQEGSGDSLGKGIEVGGTVRVAVWGPTLSWLSHFLGNDNGWEMGARAHCKEGIGAPSPLANKEKEEPDSRILSTDDPNDVWIGPCEDQTLDPESDPASRPQPNCWLYGDWQVLAGDGHLTNEGRTSMNGLIAPDVRCQGAPADSNKCTSRLYLPNNAAPNDSPPAVNTLKSLTMDYIVSGGYNGPEPIPGVYSGVHTANVAQMEGVSNNFLVQAIASRYGLGDLLVVYVYANGRLWDGNQNFDYVEVIGLEVVRIVYLDANTVAVVPVYPDPADYTGPGGDAFTLRGFLPKTLQDIEDAGFDVKPRLIMW